MDKNNGKNLNVLVLRDGKEKSFNITPTAEEIKTIGIYLGTEEDASCIIKSIYENSPAEKAKIQVGDEILEVNGESVNGDYNKAIELIQTSEENVNLVLSRNKKEVEIEVILFRSYL